MKPSHYDQWVADRRPTKGLLAADRPVAAFTEVETLPDGRCGTVLTVVLSNRECPYRCVFCGLWGDTLDQTPAVGTVAAQVERAIEQFGRRDAIKLYNAGSFFDDAAISPADRDRIARLCDGFGWVIVESRPELVDQRAISFANRLAGRLQIAIGIEMADDQILALLNKRMTLRSIRRACAFAQGSEVEISLRAFVMVQPPLVQPAVAMRDACWTVDFAAECGMDTVTLIRTYPTPGAMETLLAEGFWQVPSVWTVYEAARQSAKRTGLVTLVDRWSLGQGPNCPNCFEAFDAAFEMLNTERELPAVACSCHEEYVDRLKTALVRSIDEYRAFLRSQMRSAEVSQNTDGQIT